jgi:hypothetical protein
MKDEVGVFVFRVFDGVVKVKLKMRVVGVMVVVVSYDGVVCICVSVEVCVMLTDNVAVGDGSMEVHVCD